MTFKPLAQKVAILIYSLTSCLYSVGQVKPHIIGGGNGTISQVPYQVLIDLNGIDEAGGAIIAPNWILTAAHVVYNVSTNSAFPANDFMVYAGITDRTNKSSGQAIMPDNIIINPLFNYNTAANDIALIHLSSPLVYNNNVNQIPVATQNDENAGYMNPGVVAQVSGWGYINNNQTQPNILQILNETIVANNTIVQNLYPYPITNSNLAAGGTNGQGACHGDSGGPLTVVGANGVRILAGLVDFGANGNCASGNPDIYVRISSYSNYIAQNTSSVTGTQPCCSNFATTYTLNALVPTSNISWTTSDFSPSTGNGANATISSNNGYTDPGTITYSFVTPQGGTVNAVININNGQVINANLTNDGKNELGTVNSVNPGQTTVYVTADNAPSYSWSLISGSGISWGPNGNGGSMTFVLNSGQSGTWSVTANNRCSSYRDLTFTTQHFYSYGFDIFQQSAHNIVIKARPPKGTSASKVYTFNIALYSPMNVQVLQIMNINNSASFSTANFAKGKYKLVISKGEANVSVPLIIP